MSWVPVCRNHDSSNSIGCYTNPEIRCSFPCKSRKRRQISYSTADGAGPSLPDANEEFLSELIAINSIPRSHNNRDDSHLDGILGRQKRNVNSGSRGRGKARGWEPLNTENEPVTISVPTCEEEGVVLFTGDVNYYLRCFLSKEQHKFIEVVYICPPQFSPMAPNITECIPPMDCSNCVED